MQTHMQAGRWASGCSAACKRAPTAKAPSADARVGAGSPGESMRVGAVLWGTWVRCMACGAYW
eukprot:327528-Chlamydomonas_euryale.AAC.1